MKHVERLVETLGALALAAVVLIVLIQVVGRYVLQLSLSWPEELARYVLVWLMFFGAAAAAARHQQIIVDTVTEMVPRPVRRVMQVIAAVAGLTAVAILVWTSRPLFGPASRSTSPATGIASFWIYVSLPIGGALLGLFTLADLSRLVGGRSLERPDRAGSSVHVAEERHG